MSELSHITDYVTQCLALKDPNQSKIIEELLLPILGTGSSPPISYGVDDETGEDFKESQEIYECAAKLGDLLNIESAKRFEPKKIAALHGGVDNFLKIFDQQIDCLNPPAFSEEEILGETDPDLNPIRQWIRKKTTSSKNLIHDGEEKYAIVALHFVIYHMHGCQVVRSAYPVVEMIVHKLLLPRWTYADKAFLDLAVSARCLYPSILAKFSQNKVILEPIELV